MRNQDPAKLFETYQIPIPNHCYLRSRGTKHFSFNNERLNTYVILLKRTVTNTKFIISERLIRRVSKMLDHRLHYLGH